MKKISLFLVGLLTLLSCEQEEMDILVKNDVKLVQTRVANSIADFDPIGELRSAGIPVNIINVGNTTYKYLSYTGKTSNVDLAEKDDGSMKQRWYFKSGNIVLSGGYSGFQYSPVLSHHPTESYPVLASVNLSFMPISYSTLSFVPNSNSYYITGFKPMSGSQPPFPLPASKYLQADTKGKTALRYKESNSSDLSRWQIVPVGNFKIINMEYESSVINGDFINRKDVYLDGAVIGDVPSPVQHTFQISKTLIEGSSFSEPHGITTQEQSSFGWSVGLAVDKVNIGFNGQINNSVSTSESVTYGTNKTSQTTVTQTFTVTIPAHTPCRIEILKISFNASITYVATVEKVDGNESGKRFRIKGKWDGVASSDLYYNIYSSTDGKLIDSQIVSQ